jgi:hypothetical protein
MSSFAMAKFDAGVCQGSLVRAVEPRHGVVSSSTKLSEYCLLVGVRLQCFESWLTLDKAEHPTAVFSIVGASAISGSGHDYAFRLVTNQGTHLWCSALTSACRDVWLRALHAGLERSLTLPTSPPQLAPVKPRYQATSSRLKNLPKFCHCCGKLERYEFPLHSSCAPLSQYGMEDRMDLCPKCDLAQGLVDHCTWVHELYASRHQEQQALLAARTVILKKLSPKLIISPTLPTTNLELTPLSHHLLAQVLKSHECTSYCRVSPTLERLSLQFTRGSVGCLEFVELLEDAVGVKDMALAKLKLQAFRVAGDMGTALKLLKENALPNYKTEINDNAALYHSSNQNSTELLQCILEFLLDLLQEGELQTLAFFWPQLLNIHLQMLPPRNATSLQRIELVEDFLLTVATQHSVHLAIELIWSHTADLEDAKTLSYCANRKHAVLRFLCEVESLLFDFDAGWGGGSVTVGQFLSPSTHQIALLKRSMKSIQSYRLSAQMGRLSRSHRFNKLSGDKTNHRRPEVLAEEALRIAKNADYLSSHLAFTKRLCDIAERLRFLPVEERPQFLQIELSKLNTSGTMGGDPLNNAKTDHSRVVRIPTTEGHVFRSKERTPVLLLVELNDEGAETQEARCTLTPFPTSQSMRANEEQEEKKSLEVEDQPAEEEEAQTTASTPPRKTDGQEPVLVAESTPPEADSKKPESESTRSPETDSKEAEAESALPGKEKKESEEESTPAEIDTKEELDDVESTSSLPETDTKERESKVQSDEEPSDTADPTGDTDKGEHSDAKATAESALTEKNSSPLETDNNETEEESTAPETPKQDMNGVVQSPSIDFTEGISLCGSQDVSEEWGNSSRRKCNLVWRSRQIACQHLTHFQISLPL